MPRLVLTLALASIALTLTATPSLSASTKDKVNKKTVYGAIAWHRETSSIGYS